MKTLKESIQKYIDSYTNIPDFIKGKLFNLIPHSEDEFIERCLDEAPRGLWVSDDYVLCPFCKKIEKSSKEKQFTGTCTNCGSIIGGYQRELVCCSEIIFSNDSRLSMPTFYKINCEYNFISKHIKVKIYILNQSEGVFSDFVNETAQFHSLNLKRNTSSDVNMIKDFKSTYVHSGYDFYIKTDKRICNPLDYCLLYIRYPQVELLIKTKYAKVIQELLYNPSISLENMFKRNFKQGKKLKEVLAAPAWVMDPKLTLAEMNDARITYTKYNPSKESFEQFLELNLRKNEIKLFKQILAMKFHDNPLYTFDKLISYIGRCDMYQAIYPYDCVTILRDYLNMCISMDTLPDVNSNSLKREHDIAARNFNLIVDKIIEDNFIQKAKGLKIYEYENKKYKILVPKTPQELINEGKNNRNCVGSYVKSFSEGNSKIFFIRDKKHIDSSYVTLEMRGSCITQAYLSANRTITDKPTLDFIAEWQNHLINKKIIREHSE